MDVQESRQEYSVDEEATLELGVQAMKPKQRDAILTYMSGTDTLVVIPTEVLNIRCSYNKLRGKPFPGFFLYCV